jgi:hypothetical protein
MQTVATFTVSLFQNGCYPIAIQLSCDPPAVPTPAPASLLPPWFGGLLNLTEYWLRLNLQSRAGLPARLTERQEQHGNLSTGTISSVSVSLCGKTDRRIYQDHIQNHRARGRKATPARTRSGIQQLQRASGKPCAGSPGDHRRISGRLPASISLSPFLQIPRSTSYLPSIKRRTQLNCIKSPLQHRRCTLQIVP